MLQFIKNLIKAMTYRYDEQINRLDQIRAKAPAFSQTVEDARRLDAQWEEHKLQVERALARRDPDQTSWL